MYTSEESDYDWDGDDIVRILDPEGNTVCLVSEDYAEALLSHLNRG